ncbi:capsular polysaccharide export protein, LipB/KpsS family [Falsiroseomonas tokyonensis]|uniref:Capsular biosynthesis protein n=1 Tax=Falsiroseomonas tokyonensis TaxID=430521 RepID=A0ABV7BZ83_9PROT|nr:hypothetical protein [Falsiroseomonas tokyonensis]MBU8540172.1 hypothetical protein [Falsiroseomonas tokyonensis]
MPIIDPTALSLTPAQVEAVYWKTASGFRATIKKLFEQTWRVPEPLPLIRFLQLVQRPQWAIAHREGSRDVLGLTNALLPVLRGAQARLIIHSPYEVVEAPNLIRFAHHGGGRRRQVWHFKAAALPDHIAIDRDGYGGSSEIFGFEPRRLEEVQPAEAEAFHAALAADYAGRRKSKYPQDEKAAVPAPGFILVPLQLRADAVIAHKLFSQPYVEGMAQAIASLAAAGHRVVVKRHPLCDDKAVGQMLAELPPGVEVSKASVHSLLPACRGVAVLNSGVGFEALIYLRPVLAMGKAEYAVASRNLADPAEAGAAMEEAIAGFDALRVKRFLTLAVGQFQADLRDPLTVQRQVLRALCWNFLETAPR